MGQVLIVSNRLPVSVRKVDGRLEFSPSLGGLATGLSSYARNRNNVWVGWPGIASEDVTEREKQQIARELAKHHCRPVFLTRRQINDYYNGFSNGVLWPVLHNLPLDKAVDQRRWWRAYQTVNRLFAEAVVSHASQTSLIWVHDYQLLLVPELLRDSFPQGQIGFFLHVPFPAPKTFNKIHRARQLLIGILGANLVGFHTSGYTQEFLASCQRHKIGIVTDAQVILPNRSVQVTKFPIGVDYEKYARSGQLPAVKQALRRYRQRYGRRKLIVAVDRLEPSKGLVERLKAYREFLLANPRQLGKVSMVMVAAPSRMEVPAYQRLKVRLEKLGNDINESFGTAHWQPLDLMCRSLPFEEVTALYRLADVAFIAPLRDGMNLVAKEYIASKRNNGVLILSHTAGAAEELRDALIVNPRQPLAVAAALQQSLNMPRPELRRRLRAMQRQLAGNTIQHWAGSFVKSLQQPVPGTRPRPRAVKGAVERQLISRYRLANARLLFIDYDGTLVPFKENFAAAKPSQAVLRVLERLAADRSNQVVIISGRKAGDLDRWLGHLKLNFVAEHGAVIKRAGSEQWHTIEHVDTEWKHELLPILEKYRARTPGAKVEIKPHSLVWHYRSSPPYHAQKYVVTLKHTLKPLLSQYGVRLYQGNKVLEIKNPHVNKGTAARRWLQRRYDFVMAIGDDYTDEELFAELAAEQAVTIRVGSGRTAAGYRVKTTEEVVGFLKQLLSFS